MKVYYMKRKLNRFCLSKDKKLKKDQLVMVKGGEETGNDPPLEDPNQY